MTPRRAMCLIWRVIKSLSSYFILLYLNLQVFSDVMGHNKTYLFHKIFTEWFHRLYRFFIDDSLRSSRWSIRDLFSILWCLRSIFWLETMLFRVWVIQIEVVACCFIRCSNWKMKTENLYFTSFFICFLIVFRFAFYWNCVSNRPRSKWVSI